MQCEQMKRDGKQCMAPGLAGKKYCAIHAEPGRAAQLGSKGGRRRALCSPGNLKDFATPKTAADLRDLLAESLIELRAGKLDPRVANALGYLGASYLRALEISDLESRLDALEATQNSQDRVFLQTNAPHLNQEGGT
jgi:hypothetical protein